MYILITLLDNFSIIDLPLHFDAFEYQTHSKNQYTFSVGKTTEIAFRAQWNFTTPCWSFFSWLIPATASSADMQTGGFRLTAVDGLIVTRKINT